MLERMWVNQPSTLQICHELNGTNVLADYSDTDGARVTIYFLTGDTVSAMVPKLILAKGWRKQKDA